MLFFIGSVCFGEAAEIGNELRVTTTESLLLFLLLSSLGAGIVPFRVIPAEAWEGEADSPAGQRRMVKKDRQTVPAQAGNAEGSRTNSGTNASGDGVEGNTPQRGSH